jgi:hypothetical protein
MNWFKKNIKWFGPTVAMFILVLGFIAPYIQLPASAADLDRLVGTVQQMQDNRIEDKKDHQIKHLQDQIANVRLQFMSNGRPLSPEALFYIQEKETEIENIRKGED